MLFQLPLTLQDLPSKFTEVVSITQRDANQRRKTLITESHWLVITQLTTLSRTHGEQDGESKDTSTSAESMPSKESAVSNKMDHSPQPDLIIKNKINYKNKQLRHCIVYILSSFLKKKNIYNG